jgi:4-aminobutyrate aminotransferase
MMAHADLMTWAPGAHASTFGGNPVCLAAALETVRLLEEKLVANAAAIGTFLMRRLERLKSDHKSVVDVRGRGLMIGVELTTHEIRDRVIDECFKRGLLVLGAGPTTIRLSPPLIIDEEQAAFAADILSESIYAVSSVPPSSADVRPTV